MARTIDCRLDRESFVVSVADEMTTIRTAWPAEFNDGARGAFLQRYDGCREAGGYPVGFHQWPLARRNAWFAGFNVGRRDRLRLLEGQR
jgi:hypothetical protein